MKRNWYIREGEDKHFYQLLCIHRLVQCHNSVYTIDILPLSWNEHFDTRTLIKPSPWYCVNIFLKGVKDNVIASRRPWCLWCIRHLVCTRWMKLTWASGYPLHRHWFCVLCQFCVYEEASCVQTSRTSFMFTPMNPCSSPVKILNPSEYICRKSFTIYFEGKDLPILE